MTQDTDPVSAPEAYRQSLLAALGDDDPAVAQLATPAGIRAIVAEAGSLLRVRPEPGEWSVPSGVTRVRPSSWLSIHVPLGRA